MSKLHIVVPMAGSGTRFRQAGYDLPKPFIDVAGQPMITRVLENLHHPDAAYILIARRQDQARLEALKLKQTQIIYTEYTTEGAACTVLLARGLIDNDRPLLIANADQLVDIAMTAMVADMQQRKLGGLILTFPEQSDPKWSYARTDELGLVVETKEKKAISNQATVGIYLFAHGDDFVRAATKMIASNDRTNGEFYLCPVYNYLIAEGKRIGIHSIVREAMHGLGTPEDLRHYLDSKTTR